MSYVELITAYRLSSSVKGFLEIIRDPIGTKIELDIEKDDKILSFKLMHGETQLREEDYLRCFGQEWVVKEVNKDGTYIEIVAKHNIEKLEHTPFASFKTDSFTLVNTLNALFPYISDYGGLWSAALASDVTDDSELMSRNRTIDLERCMAIDVIESIASTWFLEYSIDTLNRVVTFHKQRGEDRGAYFTSQLNLRKVKSLSDTYDLVTRLIPIGKDGINIASVNGGVITLDNLEFVEKTLSAYWIDNRYTDPNHLKEDGLRKLQELAKPLKTYACDIIDLSGEYPILEYGVGDTVTIIDENLEIRDVQRITRMVVYPYEPENNTAELANRRATFSEMQSQLLDTRDVVNNSYFPNGRIVFTSVDGLPTFKQTVETDLASLTTTVETLEQTVSEIDVSAYIVSLGNESQAIQVDENYKLVDDQIYGTTVYSYLGGDRGEAIIGQVQFFSSEGNPITSLTVDYNENNIYNSDFSDGLLPNFDGEEETINGTTTIGAEYATVAHSGATAATFVIGVNNFTSTYFSNPELPFYPNQPITFSAYIRTSTNTLATTWALSHVYAVDDEVSYEGQNYKCLVDHTSVDFYNDLASEKWEKIGYAYIAIYEWVGGVRSEYISNKLGISESGLLIANHTVDPNATNIALAIVSDYGTSGAHTLEFKQPKLEEGYNATTYTNELDIKNNFEIKNPSETEEGFVTTTLIKGTYLPSNVGYLEIPIFVDGIQFFKRIVFTRTMTSENSTYINIIPTSIIMGSQDGGATFTPSSIRLYPDIRNLTYVKWQYSHDGYNFYDMPPYKGTLITTSAVWDSLGDVLVIPTPPTYPDAMVFEDFIYDSTAFRVEDADGYQNTFLIFATSSLFTREVDGQIFPFNSVVVRLLAMDGESTTYSDTVTLSRAYDSRETIKTLESNIRTDIESVSESVREFRNDLYYFNEETGRYELYTSDYTQFKQDVNNFILTVQDGGGANLLKDSVGVNYPTSNVWSLLSGSVSKGVATSWGLSYISKHSWYIQTGSLKQEVVLQPQNEYTFSCAYKKPISGTVTFTIKASSWSAPVTMITKPAGESFEGSAKFTFMSGANTRFEITMTVDGATEPVEITDVMLSLGKISSWQQSNGELFATNVIIDATGIKVNDVNGNGYTIISPFEFAGYYDGNRIFTLNGTKTEVQELVAKGGGIYVAPVKLIQVSGATPRAAFVWTGSEGE